MGQIDSELNIEQIAQTIPYKSVRLEEVEGRIGIVFPLGKVPAEDDPSFIAAISESIRASRAGFDIEMRTSTGAPELVLLADEVGPDEHRAMGRIHADIFVYGYRQ